MELIQKCSLRNFIGISFSRAILYSRKNFSLVNFYDLLIFLTGGEIIESRDDFTSEVYLYDIKADKWKSGPAMNYKRQNHSSCALGISLYVYGGFNCEKDSLPMERLTTSPNHTMGHAFDSW